MLVVAVASAIAALVLCAAASGATVECGKVYVSELGYARISLSVKSATMNDIYRDHPGAFHSRGDADCELAIFVAELAAREQTNVRSVEVKGLGRYACDFGAPTKTITLGSGPSAVHLPAEEVTCRLAGHDSNSVRFLAIELRLRKEDVDETERETQEAQERVNRSLG
jgi:hypothetical protein